MVRSLADINGYVGGKTGTSQNYNNFQENLNTFISIFPKKPKYSNDAENPKVAKDLIYNYRGLKKRYKRGRLELSLRCWQNNKKIGLF